MARDVLDLGLDELVADRRSMAKESGGKPADHDQKDRPILEAIEKLHVVILKERSKGVGWESSLAVLAARDEISKILDGSDVETVKRLYSSARAMARASVANSIQAVTNRETGSVKVVDKDKRDALEALWVVVFDEAVTDRNLFLLPYEDEATKKRVTFAELKTQKVTKTVRGKPKDFPRENEVVFSWHKGDDGRRHSAPYHAPNYQNKPLVQAMVNALKGARTNLKTMADEGAAHAASKNAAGNGRRESSGHSKVTGELEARGLTVHLPEADEPDEPMDTVQDRVHVADKTAERLERADRRRSGRQRRQ